MEPLPRTFFDRNASVVAPELVGCLLVRRARGVTRACRIVETEAYLGPHDLASHSRVGKTARNAPMFGPPGHAYVYLIYGLHHCLNAVCGPGGHPSAVLLRAAAPLEVEAPLLHSATGPGNLCRALSVTRAQDEVDLCSLAGGLWIAPRSGPAPRIWRGPRVGVDYAGAWAGRRYRFCDRDCPQVSRPRPPGR